MTSPELNAELRNLIDVRLDQIEQVLLRAQVSYSERRHIVGDVESQIFELLARRGENPARDDVLAVLDSLDPAEAYVPEELRGKLADSSAPPAPRRPAGPRMSKLAILSALVAAPAAVIGLFLMATVHPNNADEVALFFGCILVLACGLGLAAITRIVLSAGKLRGLPYALFASILLPVAVANVLIVLVLMATHNLIPWIVTGAGILYLNYLAIRRVSRWLSERREHLAEALRHAFTGKTPEQNGIHAA